MTKEVNVQNIIYIKYSTSIYKKYKYIQKEFLPHDSYRFFSAIPRKHLKQKQI